jgi:hypothetical protein
MALRRILLVLIGIVLILQLRGLNLAAAEYYSWVHGSYYGPTPYYVGNPKQIDPVQATSAAGASQSSPTQHSGVSPRAYPYGYFGAQYRYYTLSHKNYTNDYIQWSLRRGY